MWVVTQTLKPHSFCGVYGVAEVEDPGPAGATTHKHSRVATQTLKPGPAKKLKGYARRDEFEDYYDRGRRRVGWDIRTRK
jgi:hypothetical protein